MIKSDRVSEEEEEEDIFSERMAGQSIHGGPCGKWL